MKILLTTCNAKFIHKNLALRWLYTTCPNQDDIILKEFTIKDKVDYIVDNILAMNLNWVCFSCYIWNVEMMKEIVHKIKTQQPNIHILVGGPEVSFESTYLINEGIDAICIGEGEQVVWEYIYRQDNHMVAGIIDHDNTRAIYQKVDLAWLQKFPNPYFLDFDEENMEHQYLYVETSRGCPFGCTYCLSSTDRKVRFFDEDYIHNILNQIKSSKVKQVKLLDRTFNSQPKRALQFAKIMNEQCTAQIFQFEIVAETFNDELLEYFCTKADSQRFRFEIGVQSFNDETLKAVGRDLHTKRLKLVINRLQDAGFTLHVDLIAALPNEDFNSFKNSFNALFSFNVKELQLGMLKLLKGTKLRNQQQEFEYFMEKEAPYQVLASKWLTAKEIKKLDDCAHAVEKLYNRGICNDSINAILDAKLYDNAFDLFCEISTALLKLKNPYQRKDLFKILQNILINTDDLIVDGLLNMEYYKKSRQRPPRFSNLIVATNVRNKLVKSIVQQGLISEHTAHIYGHLTYGYKCGKSGYLMSVYNKNQDYPKQYFIGMSDHDWEVL